MVGKYLDLQDAYKSLSEAITHAGIQTHCKVNVKFVDAEDLRASGEETLQDVNAILVPGGFGERGLEGKIYAAGYARRTGMPYLGICYGLHAAVIEFARSEAGLAGASSTEVDPDAKHPVIALISEWTDDQGHVETRSGEEDLGGTMRLGEQVCVLEQGSVSARMYGKTVIRERHRHRYEVNNNYVPQLVELGLKVAGRSEDAELVEMIEFADHPWFVACQFHPEFTSSPQKGHPLFSGFVTAALAHADAAADKVSGQDGEA